MTIGLKDLNKKKSKVVEVETNPNVSLLDLILHKHEEKFTEKNQKRSLRPWESCDEFELKAADTEEMSRQREEAIIEMQKIIKKRALQLFGK